MPYKLGRKPPILTMRSMRLAIATAKALDPLGVPPDESNDYIKSVNPNCPMFGNDQYGDCTAADTGHMLMVRSANVGMPMTPTLQDVLNFYSDTTDPPFDPNDASTDNGANEVDVLNYLKSTGFLGHKLDSYGSVDPVDYNHMRWCVQLFGGCRIGVNLPQSAMDQFDANEPWDIKGDLTIVGGHDIPIVHYDPSYYYVCTWGRWKQPVTRAWMERFCDEAHPELAFDWIAKQGLAPSGFDLQDLEGKIKLAMDVPDTPMAIA
jgi:hypothetical protein